MGAAAQPGEARYRSSKQAAKAGANEGRESPNSKLRRQKLRIGGKEKNFYIVRSKVCNDLKIEHLDSCITHLNTVKI